MTTQTTERKVPLKALQFAADVAMQPVATDGAGTVPVSIKARTGKPVDHWFWGQVVHDLAGMQVPGGKIPLDYCHDAGDVIGFADKFDVATGDLNISGALTPFRDGDRANEVIFKAGKGVPYEASIFFDPFQVSIEEVLPGATVEVNGNPVVGPAVIFRQWTLRGTAVCPYGVDQNTSVQFSDDQKPEVAVKVLSPKGKPMTKTTLSGGKPAKTGALSDDAKPDDKPEAQGEQEDDIENDDCPCKGQEGSDCDKEGEGEQDEMPADEEGSDAGKQSTPTGPGAKFLTAFGDIGGRWFAEGKTFEEAQGLFAAHQSKRIEALTKENGELKTKLGMARGEKTPVKFSTPPTDVDKKAAAMKGRVGSEGLARFAAGLKLPGQN